MACIVEYLTTGVQLVSRHVPISSIFPVCSQSEESTWHILIDCPFSVSCWNWLGIDCRGLSRSSFLAWCSDLMESARDSTLEEATTMVWGIWQARNAFVWNQKISNAASVVFSARRLVDLYREAQKVKYESMFLFQDGIRLVEHWTPPVVSQIKVNVDGDIFSECGRYSFGCIARNHIGQVQGLNFNSFKG